MYWLVQQGDRNRKIRDKVVPGRGIRMNSWRWVQSLCIFVSHHETLYSAKGGKYDSSIRCLPAQPPQCLSNDSICRDRDWYYAWPNTVVSFSPRMIQLTAAEQSYLSLAEDSYLHPEMKQGQFLCDRNHSRERID